MNFSIKFGANLVQTVGVMTEYSHIEQFFLSHLQGKPLHGMN